MLEAHAVEDALAFHDTGDIISGNIGEWHWQSIFQKASPNFPIRRIDTGSVNSHQYLICLWRWTLYLLRL